MELYEVSGYPPITQNHSRGDDETHYFYVLAKDSREAVIKVLTQETEFLRFNKLTVKTIKKGKMVG